MTPILVSHAARTGTTLLMRTLNQSKKIVIARTGIFEVKLLSYYAHALRVLTSPPDWKNSTHPSRLGGDRMSIGFNPYTHENFANAFKRNRQVLKDMRTEAWPPMIAAAFRRCITAYYEELADQYRLTEPLFFAEKNDSMNRDVVAFTRKAYGSCKNVVTFRHPLDIYCSQRSFFKSDSAQAAQNVINATKGIARIMTEPQEDCFLLRYEDMVLDSFNTVRRLGDFLGVDDLLPIPREQGFIGHGTSSSVEESIGRWKTDMNRGELDAVVPEITEPMRVLGYEV